MEDRNTAQRQEAAQAQALRGQIVGGEIDVDYRNEMRLQREQEQARFKREAALNQAFALAAQTGQLSQDDIIRSAKVFLNFAETGYGLNDPQPCAGTAPYEDAGYVRQRALDYATQSLGRNGGPLSELLDRARQIETFITAPPSV